MKATTPDRKSVLILTRIVVTSALYAALGHGAEALTFRRTEMTCPYSGQKLEATTPASGTSFGAAFDFKPFGPIMAPYPYPVCDDGFVFYQDKFSDMELQRLKPLVLSDQFRLFKDESVHYRGAWLKTRLQATSGEISAELLYATWEAKNPEAYKRYAGDLLSSLPAAISSETDPKKKLRLQLIEGEVLRRLGKLDDARRYFEKLSTEIGDGTDEATIIRLQLAMIASGETGSAIIPRDKLDEARSEPAWLAARRPMLPANSSFVGYGTQFLTNGRLGFFWSLDSESLIAGRFVLTPEGLIDVYPSAGERQVRHLQFSDPMIRPVAALPGGRILAVTMERTADQTTAFKLVELDANSGNVLAEAPGYQTYSHAQLSFDHKIAVIDSDKTNVNVYLLEGHALEKEPVKLKAGEIVSAVAAVDPGGPLILLQTTEEKTYHDGDLAIWNYAARGSALRIKVPKTDDYGAGLADALFDTPNGKLIVAWQAFRGKKCLLQSFDLATGTLLQSRDSDGQEPSLSLSGDQRLLSFTCGAKLEILDPRDLAKVREGIEAPRDFVFSQARFSPDTRHLAIEIDNVVTVLEMRR